MTTQSTFRVEGELVPMSRAWRRTFRNEYRSRRNRGFGPLTAKAMVEDEILFHLGPMS